MYAQLITEQEREEFVVNDVLQLGNNDAPRFLVETLVVPVWVDFNEEIGDAVVLAHPGLRHGCQADERVDSWVACSDGALANRDTRAYTK